MEIFTLNVKWEQRIQICHPYRFITHHKFVLTITYKFSNVQISPWKLQNTAKSNAICVTIDRANLNPGNKPAALVVSTTTTLHDSDRIDHSWLNRQNDAGAIVMALLSRQCRETTCNENNNQKSCM